MDAPATFVMPHYSDHPAAARYLEKAVDGLYAQTDRDWQLVIVDDASPHARDRARLRRLSRADGGRIHVLALPHNGGQGVCRNIGVRWASERGSPFVLFHDADDVSHPRRLELTRRAFVQRPEVDFVYSTFVVIDEDDEPVPPENLTPSVAEILQSHRTPVEGRSAWIRIGTETGYTTLTSTVAVRTRLAVAHPFPNVRGSEDGHTWLRMAAGNGSLAFLADIPARYRIPQTVAGSSDRARIGSAYYRRKATVDTDGFDRAVAIALDGKAVDPAQVPELKARFLRRLATTMAAEGQHDLARELLALATVTGPAASVIPAGRAV